MQDRVEADALQSRHRTLRVTFETLEEFREEFQTNLVRGGLFIPSNAPVALREEVLVELDLRFRGASFKLPAEVVSVVAPELAQAGGTPGIAVQVTMSAADLRREFAPIVGQVPAPDPGRQVGERRTAPRREARVVGQLSSADASLAVRTRDLSHSGVLVTIEGAPPVAVGESVALALVHPVTGQQLEVEGSVVRHVESGGGVPALAVAFSAREASRTEVQRFVDDLHSVQHARNLAGISGAIREVGLANLLQSFAAASRRGTLTVTRDAEEGRVAFEGGKLVAAQLGPVAGSKALARLLTWEDGRFEFHAHVDAGAGDEERLSLDVALLEATRQLDERKRLEPLPVALTDHLDVLAPGPEGELSKTEAAVLDLARAGFNVRSMLDVIPEEDHVVLRGLCGLLERGLVRRSGRIPVR